MSWLICMRLWITLNDFEAKSGQVMEQCHFLSWPGVGRVHSVELWQRSNKGTASMTAAASSVS